MEPVVKGRAGYSAGAGAPSLGLRGRLGKALFGSLFNSMLTVLGCAALAFIAWTAFRWALLDAVFSPVGAPETCHGAGGACWAVIAQRWRLILFGLYPHDLHLRSAMAGFLLIGAGILVCTPAFQTAGRMMLVWTAGLVGFYVLMRGGILGMEFVPEGQWGGLSLTLFVFAATITVGMPLAVILALMRRSHLPVIAFVSGLVIDCVRSLPLVSILFAAAVMMPFLLPDFLIGDKLYRVIFGFAFFFGAYQAEVLRAGFQSISGGQEEAAKALGLKRWHRLVLITLPQAFMNTLPPTISQLVMTFKETSLIVIVGFFEIMASGNAAYGTGEWRFAYVEVYIFLGVIYLMFVTSISMYGKYIEIGRSKKF